MAAVVRNAGLLAELEAILLPRLRRQNDRACSALSLELVHLLENSREASAALLAPGRKGTRVPPLRTPSVRAYTWLYAAASPDIAAPGVSRPRVRGERWPDGACACPRSPALLHPAAARPRPATRCRPARPR